MEKSTAPENVICHMIVKSKNRTNTIQLSVRIKNVPETDRTRTACDSQLSNMSKGGVCIYYVFIE